MATSPSSKLPSVPKKGTDYYKKAREYADKLKSGEISAEQCEILLAKRERLRPEVETDVDVADAARKCYEKLRDEALQQDAQASLDAHGQEALGKPGGHKRKSSSS